MEIIRVAVSSGKRVISSFLYHDKKYEVMNPIEKIQAVERKKYGTDIIKNPKSDSGRRVVLRTD